MDRNRFHRNRFHLIKTPVFENNGFKIMDNIRKKEGFADQVLHVIPRPLLAQDTPLTQSLCVTDIGWYPRASGHYRERPHGAAENLLIVCVSGEGRAEIKGRVFRIARNQALLIPRGVPHRYAADEAEPWSIHWIHCRGETSDYFNTLLPDGDYRIPLSETCLAELDTAFRSSYSAIQESYGRENLLYLAALAHHVMGLLFFHNSAYSPVRRAPACHDLRETVKLMVERCTENLTRADLARHANLSPAHFSLLFHRQKGLSPVKFLNQQRVRRACRLMMTTAHTISEIAGEVGYDDPYYFSRVFRKEMGISPRQYRVTYTRMGTRTE